MPDGGKEAAHRKFVRSILFRQFVAAGIVLIGLLYLAGSHTWPFGTEPPDLGGHPSMVSLLLNDRLMLGFLRAALVFVAIFVVLSIPALIVAGRWMKGLSTSGLTTDDGREVDDSIEAVQRELRATQDDLQQQVEQSDMASQLLLEFLANQAEGDEAAEEEDNGSDGTP